MDFAYLDPGTGSLFLQAIMGVLLGGIVVFRNFIFRALHRVKSIFSRASADDKK